MFIDEIAYQALDKKGEAQAVALDVSKTFDRHAGLIHDLKFMVFLETR